MPLVFYLLRIALGAVHHQTFSIAAGVCLMSHIFIVFNAYDFLALMFPINWYRRAGRYGRIIAQNILKDNRNVSAVRRRRIKLEHEKPATFLPEMCRSQCLPSINQALQQSETFRQSLECPWPSSYVWNTLSFMETREEVTSSWISAMVVLRL